LALYLGFRVSAEIRLIGQGGKSKVGEQPKGHPYPSPSPKLHYRVTWLTVTAIQTKWLILFLSKHHNQSIKIAI
jgi:hypothetical protein